MMNSEERDLISRFIARVGGGQEGFGSVGQVDLPPIDPEADRFIGENFQRYPEARYRVTQLAVVQEAALAQAQNRIRNLEFQLQQARNQIAELQNQMASVQKPGGFFSNLFGHGAAPQQPRRPSMPMPSGWNDAGGAMNAGGYAPPPGYQQGMFPRSGTGFLGSALTTAAGVAGGIMAADALENLFSGHHDKGSVHGDALDSSNETIINNNYGDSFTGDFGMSGDDPFSGSGTEAEGFRRNDFGGYQDTDSWSDSGGSDTAGSGWGDSSGDFGGDGDSFDDSMF